MAILAALALLTLAPSLARAQCVADCDSNRVLIVSEMVTAVGIALGAPLAQCPPADADRDEQVAVNELIMAVATSLGSCPSAAFVTDVVQSMQVVDFGAVGVSRGGSPPAASGGPSAATASGATVVPGGSSLLRVTADAPFSTVFLSVEAEAVAAAGASAGVGGIDGYLEVTLPAPATEVLLQMVVNAAVTDSFRWLLQVGDAEGRVGDVARTVVDIVTAGTGDLQINLSWDADSDVDLYVLEPTGETIWYNNRTTSSGGRLDLDARCSSELPSENVTWAGGRAPRGRYVVRVNYFGDCQVERTHYAVSIRRLGRVPIIVNGHFSGPGTPSGDDDAGIIVAEFDF